MIINYPISEFVASVYRRYFRTQAPLERTRLDSGDIAGKPFQICFLGDICPIGERNLVVDSELSSLFESCDRMVGNFEGVVTSQPTRAFKLKHDPSILRALTSLKQAADWSLAVANNHAGDYGCSEFQNSLETLAGRGLNTFGTRSNPYADLGHGVVLSNWTLWSNRSAPSAGTRDPGPMGEFPVAYPHWGYEFVSAPDASMTLPEGYPLVVGHHTHSPLGLESIPDGPIVAWSLGNFCTGNQLQSQSSGAVLRVTLDVQCGVRLITTELIPTTITVSERAVLVAVRRSGTGPLDG